VRQRAPQADRAMRGRFCAIFGGRKGGDPNHRNNSRSQAAHSLSAETGHPTLITVAPRRSSMVIDLPVVAGFSICSGMKLALSRQLTEPPAAHFP